MALEQKSYIGTSTGNTWLDLITGAATVTSLTLANLSLGDVSVAVQISKASGGSAYIVPDHTLPMRGSSRMALPAVVLEEGDKLQVKSSSSVDWVASITRAVV